MNDANPSRVGFTAQGNYDISKVALLPHEAHAGRPTTTLRSTTQQAATESRKPSPITVSIATPLMREKNIVDHGLYPNIVSSTIEIKHIPKIDKLQINVIT